MTKNNLSKDLLLNILKSMYDDTFSVSSNTLISLKEFEFFLTSLFLELNPLQKRNMSLLCKEFIDGETSFNIDECLHEDRFDLPLFEKYNSFFSKSSSILTKFYFTKFLYFHKKFVKYGVLMSQYDDLEENIDLLKNYKDYVQQSVHEASLHLTIRYACNNIFCTLSNVLTNKILYATSTGREKLKASKKNLRFISKLLLLKFLEHVKKSLIDLKREQVIQKILITLIVPKKSRKFILMLLQNFFKTSNELVTEIVLHFKENKCFNGCRPKKQQRKKRKGFKHLK